MKLKSNKEIPVFKYEDNNNDFQKFDLESYSANRLYNNIIDQLNTKSITYFFFKFYFKLNISLIAARMIIVF